jgi:uncharacterized protein YdeI (BOF family)
MRKTFIAALVMLIAGVAFAANEGKDVTLTGYIVDNVCAPKYAVSPDLVKAHTVACALARSCVKSGYAFYSDGKLYELDQDGNTKAEALLRNTGSKTGPQVKIEGSLDGDTLKVKSISEAS